MYAQVIVDFQTSKNAQLILSDEETDITEANVSNITKIVDPENYTYQGCKGFHLGTDTQHVPSKLDGSYVLYDTRGYSGWITQDLSDDAQLTTAYLVMQIPQDKIPKYLYLRFDEVAKEYAETFEISNSQNDNIITITNNTKPFLQIDITSLQLESISWASPITLWLDISKWCRPNANIKITQFSASYVGVYTNDLIEVESSENLLDAQLNVSPGIVENYANIEIYDRYKILHTLAEQELLLQNLPVTISLIDGVVENVIGKFTAKEWQLTSENSHVLLTCRDNSLVLESINFSSLEVETRTVADLISLAFKAVKNVTCETDVDTDSYMRSIKIPNSWCYSSNVKEFLQKICDLAQLRIYWYIDRYIIARCY